MNELFSIPKTCSAIYNYRPLRIAFLIDPAHTSDELLNSIIEFCLEKWGGRYYPIIPCDGSSITQSYWSLLEFVDPDIIYSFVNLDKSLIEKFEFSISPFGFYVRVPDENNRAIFHGSDLENPLPNEFLIKDIHRVFRAPFYSMKNQLSVFKMDSKNNNYSFILRNFGYLKYLLEIYMKLGDDKWSIELKDEYKEIDAFEIDTDRDLSDILQEISNKRNLIYPIFLSEIPGSLPPSDYGDRDRGFLIGIGDDIQTYLYLWNRIHILDEHLRRNLSQILIPDYVFKNPDELESIKELMKNNIYQDSSGTNDLRIISSSKSREELADIVDFFKKDTYWRIDIKCSSEDFEFPTIKKDKIIPISYKQSGNIHNFNDSTTFIPNIGPIPTESKHSFHSFHWMIDIDLPYRPELFFYTNIGYLWKLPRRPGITYLFNKNLSRITSQGSISFIASSNEKSIQISIPTEKTVFWHLISPYYHYRYKRDVRQRKETEYKNIGFSDKGRYLSGVLDLFPSLWHAHRCFSNNFWRNIFYYLSNIKQKKEKNQLKQLQNKVRKAYDRAIKNYPANADKTSELLSSYLQNLMREEKYERPITFDYFYDLAKKERKAFLSTIEKKEQFNYTDEELKTELREAIQDLIDSNIIFQGIRPRCHHCGFRNWYDLSEVKTDLVCKGCHARFKFPAESQWFYKLNELIKRTMLYQGVLATLMCLGHLLEDSRESFIFIPSICLFKEYDEQDPTAELDIVCISDGDFIIGEVKNSAKLFSIMDFNKIEEVAIKIRPDKIIIFAFEGPYDNAIRLTDNLKEKMKSYDIEVKFIRPWDYINEPSYHLHPF